MESYSIQKIDLELLLSDAFRNRTKFDKKPIECTRNKGRKFLQNTIAKDRSLETGELEEERG